MHGSAHGSQSKIKSKLSTGLFQYYAHYLCLRLHLPRLGVVNTVDKVQRQSINVPARVSKHHSCLLCARITTITPE